MTIMDYVINNKNKGEVSCLLADWLCDKKYEAKVVTLKCLNESGQALCKEAKVDLDFIYHLLSMIEYKIDMTFSSHTNFEGNKISFVITLSDTSYLYFEFIKTFHTFKKHDFSIIAHFKDNSAITIPISLLNFSSSEKNFMRKIVKLIYEKACPSIRAWRFERNTEEEEIEYVDCQCNQVFYRWHEDMPEEWNKEYEFN